MGLRNSKNKPNTYDIAALAPNKDVTYKKHERPLPKVELPVKKETIESNETEETTTSSITEIKTNGIVVVEEVEEVRDPRIPDWVNENNFKNMLLKTYSNIKEVINFKAFSALAAGENYATLMLRVKITVKFLDDTTKDFSFMLKVPHDTKEMQQMLQVTHYFVVENMVYMDVIRELEKMYRQAGVEVKLAANSYRLDLEDSNIHYVLLEDLGVEAFKNANRLECLNMEHTLCVLRKMAQFHAATACRAAKKGSYPTVFSPDMDNDMARATLNQMFQSFKKPLLENLKTYENGEKYYDALDNFFDNLVELFSRGRKLLPNYFCVLNHGDAWSNNILFKYNDDGRLEETIFVDFQNSSWGSPAFDVYYFIFSSVQIDIKLSQFDYFVRYYHEQLSDNLKLFNYPLDILSLKDFHAQMINFGVLATTTSFLTLGIVLLDPTDSAKFENFLSASEESIKFRTSIYTNERYRTYINKILPWLYNRGFMEINLRDIDNGIVLANKLQQLESEQTENIELSSSCYPEWINESLFLKVVRAACENFQNILKFGVRPATKLGVNSTASLWQIDIDIELTDHTKRSISYVLKTPPHDDQAKTLAAFQKESKVYFDIIPQLEKIYNEKARLDVIFAPKCFKLDMERASDAIVLENTQIRNFENCDRLQGLDMQHIEAVLKKLAQFHAASACLFETRESLCDNYKQPAYTEEISKEMEILAESFMCGVKDYKDSEEYLSELNTCSDNVLSFLAKARCIDHNKFNVLNHGNCSIENIIFQHDNEKNVTNTYFEDFQITHYGTPCYDLLHFLLSSPRLELKLEHFDYFIRFYHENLKSNLELLGYQKTIPSLKDLHQDLLDNGVWAFYTVVFVLPTVLLDQKDKPSLKKIVGEDDEDNIAFKKLMFLNKYYRTQMVSILPWLNKRGFLDIH